MNAKSKREKKLFRKRLETLNVVYLFVSMSVGRKYEAMNSHICCSKMTEEEGCRRLKLLQNTSIGEKSGNALKIDLLISAAQSSKCNKTPELFFKFYSF